MKLSIITVCKNAGDAIERTLLSVRNQTYNEIEYIVIDGASTDNTLEIIEKYREHIDYFVSELDTGIYRAMNKGIKASTGEALYFLNAGDYLLHENSVRNFIANFDDNIDVLHGNILVDEGIDTTVSVGARKRIDKKFFLMKMIPHQATFYRHSLFDRYGSFDESYRVSSDFEYFLRVLSQNASFTYINQDIAYYPLDGISSNKKYRKMIFDEYYEIRCLYFPSFIVKVTRSLVEGTCYPFCKFLRVVFMFILLFYSNNSLLKRRGEY